jgi:hypothetical protein|tara:strand:+ start:64 stop:240 length:177 start_codon:yes stop_codon:yes gene_type:complete
MANIGRRKSRLSTFDRIHDLAVGELGLGIPHVKPLSLEKLLLLSPLVLEDDYQYTPFF